MATSPPDFSGNHSEVYFWPCIRVEQWDMVSVLAGQDRDFGASASTVVAE